MLNHGKIKRSILQNSLLLANMTKRRLNKDESEGDEDLELSEEEDEVSDKFFSWGLCFLLLHSLY